MILKVIYIFTLLHTISAQAVPKNYYTGAVVEYYTKFDTSKDSIGKNIQNNIDEYIKYIAEAASKDVDIIVFPQYGLTTIIENNSEVNRFTTVLPKFNTVVCNSTTGWSKVIDRLSCAAKQHKIYVVVNLPERTTNTIHYNTNIVLDRTGALIARYRQFNTEESIFNTTEIADITTFETDFGVTFGTFINFDILFSEPALDIFKVNNNVTDVIYTTSWESELPFLTSIQMQAGYARANGVNLLAASYSDPKKYRGGSGIYQANGDIKYHIPDKNENNMFIQNITKISKRNQLEYVSNITAKVEKLKKSSNNLQLSTMEENMTAYKTELLTETVEDKKICHENLCCTFTVKFTPQEPKEYNYRLAVYDGPRTFKNSKYNVQLCGIVACTSNNISTCGILNPAQKNGQIFTEISIKSDTFLDQGKSVIFPTNVLYNLEVLSPAKFNYSAIKNECYRLVELKTTGSVKDIIGFGVYSLTLDSPVENGGLSGAVIAVIVIAVLVVVALIGLLIWKRFKTGSYSHPGN